MNDALCLRALQPIGVDMTHYIMSNLFFPLFCHIIIDVFGILPKLPKLLFRDWKSQFLFGFRKSNPELSPSLELKARRKNLLHLGRGISPG